MAAKARSDSRSPWRLPVALLLAGFVATAWLGLQPQPGRPVAALFPPWWGLPRAFAAAAAAGGDVLRTGAWPSLLVVSAPDRGFGARLHAAGAWLILNPQALGACSPGALAS